MAFAASGLCDREDATTTCTRGEAASTSQIRESVQFPALSASASAEALPVSHPQIAHQRWLSILSISA